MDHHKTNGDDPNRRDKEEAQSPQEENGAEGDAPGEEEEELQEGSEESFPASDPPAW